MREEILLYLEKPLDPPIYTLVKELTDVDRDSEFSIERIETDEKVESVSLRIKGPKIKYELIKKKVLEVYCNRYSEREVHLKK